MAEVLEMGPTDLALAVLTFLLMGYLASQAYGHLAAQVAPAPGAPTPPPKKAAKPKEELLKPVAKKAGIPDYSLERLAAESSATKLLLGCKGRVFDASSNQMYGPEGSYNMFIGVDASVALAKMRFDAECLDASKLHWSRDLDEKELNILEEWVTKFEEKYPTVAYIKDDLKLKV